MKGKTDRWSYTFKKIYTLTRYSLMFNLLNKYIYHVNLEIIK
jgi:hypothetical protein